VKRRPSQIIALGGGGLGKDEHARALDAYVLAQAGKANPSVCFLPTATGDDDAYLARFYGECASLACRPTHISLFQRTPNLRQVLSQQDVIYVGGGNTKSMLAVWRDWRLPALLREAWRSGVVLAGVSAGAICWFDVGVTDSWADRLAPLKCLGLLPGTCCPHYDGEPERRPALHAMLVRGDVPRAIALDDSVAAHFIGRRLHRVVSPRRDGFAYRVAVRARHVVESTLEMTRL
jgi:dipeptidase E